MLSSTLLLLLAVYVCNMLQVLPRGQVCSRRRAGAAPTLALTFPVKPNPVQFKEFAANIKKLNSGVQNVDETIRNV